MNVPWFAGFFPVPSSADLRPRHPRLTPPEPGVIFYPPHPAVRRLSRQEAQAHEALLLLNDPYLLNTRPPPFITPSILR